MHSSDHVHSDHERQQAKIMAEVGSSTSSPGVSLQEWFDEDSKRVTKRRRTNKQNENTVKKIESDL